MKNFVQQIASGTSDIEGDINSFSIKVILIASLVLIVLLAISSVVISNKKHQMFKMPLFIAIAFTILLPSLLLMGSTVYINTVSESGGPVHWHTDIEFWVCGEEVELRDPYAFLSNKIGTASYHEHDDKRIHLEGVVVEKDYDASFEKFMKVTDGEITEDTLTIATEDTIFENDIDGDSSAGNQEAVRNFLQRDSNGKAVIAVENGQDCGDNEPSYIQAFLFRYNKSDDTYTQTKLDDAMRYTMRDESIVPPGDCLIVEFDRQKDSTNKLCQQYGVRDADRCTEFGVTEYNPDLCNIKQTVTSGGAL